MDRAMEVVSQWRLSVLKEPRGFMRVIQFVLAILAFATTCSHSTSSSFAVKCNNTEAGTVTYNYGYPYNLKSVEIHTLCPGDHKNELCCNVNSGAQFYVFVGVMAFLYCLAILIMYIVFFDKYENDERLPVIDFVISAALAFFFLVASSVWADQLRKVKSYTDPAEAIEHNHFGDCMEQVGTCHDFTTGDFGKLNASVLFGFLNMAVWIASLWFIFKETKWHQALPQKAPDHANNPQFPTPTPPSLDQGQI